MKATHRDSSEFHVGPGAVLVVLLVLLAWFGVLGLRELLPSDEGRYAQIAREMAASADWVTIRYNGLKYFEKPPFHLWMSALAFEFFGVGTWQARLWVALGGLIGIAAMMLACARWWGGRVATLCGLVMIAMPLWSLGAQFNSLDMGVSAALCVVLAAFLLAQHPEASASQRRRWMLASWAAMGIAVLSKGLIGIVLPGLVLCVYTLWSRDWALWRRLHLSLGLLVFACVAVPWFWLVSTRNPEFAHFFFIHEHFQRYTSTVHSRANPWWYFIPLIAAGCLPWIGLWWGMVKQVWQAPREAHRRGTARLSAGGPVAVADRSGVEPKRLLAAWALSIFVFFSASGSKLPGYILPVLPALAALAALALARLSERAWRRQLIAMAVLSLGLAALSPLVGRLGSEATPQIHFVALSHWLVAAALLSALTALLAYVLARQARLGASRAVYALGILAATLLGAVGHDEVGRVSSGVAVVPAVSRVLTPDMPLYGVRRLDHTVPFHLRHRLTLVEMQDELAFGIRQEPDRWIPTLALFAERWQHGPRALALMTPATYSELAQKGFEMVEIARDTRRVIVANFNPVTP